MKPNRTRKSAACCRTWRRPGVTLIEVVAATALAATLLVTTLVAISRHARQAEVAATKRQAIEAAEQLLHSWRQAENWDSLAEAVPLRGETGEEDNRLRWTLTQVSAPTAIRVGETRLATLRLEFFQSTNQPVAPQRLVHVDFVVNLPTANEASPAN